MPFQDQVSGAPTAIAVHGEALSTCLPRLGRELGARLTAAPDLAGQRITVLAPSLSLPELKEDIKELLSPSAAAPVLWGRVGTDDAWRLEQSKNRRELMARLDGAGVECLRQFLNSRIEWARGEGLRELAAAPATKRKFLLSRLQDMLLLDCLGADGRERLLRGEILSLTGKEIAASPNGELLKEYLGNRFKNRSAPPGIPADFDRHTFIFNLSKHTSDALATRPCFAARLGGGSVTVRTTMPCAPHTIADETFFIARAATLDEPYAGEPADGPRVSFCLTPDPDAKPGATVERNLDQLLDQISRETGRTIVADGYLRASYRIPANLMLRNCRLDRLLQNVAHVWLCDWHFSKRDPNTIFFRAKNWWLEDQADVPQATLNELRKRFKLGQAPSLEDLLDAAQLTEAQGNKLRETGLVPGLPDMDSEGFQDNANARTTLRFIWELTPAQRERALSPAGLPMAEVDPALTARTVERAMKLSGALDETVRQRAIFHIWVKRNKPDGPVSSWTFEFRSPQDGYYGGHNVRVPSPPAPAL